MSLGRARGVLGIKPDRVPGVLERAELMLGMMGADPGTYSAPSPTLPAFKILIDNVSDAQAAARRLTIGAAATRDVQCGLLIQGMKSELFYVQSLASAAISYEHSVALILNAGILIAGYTGYDKPFLKLTPGVASGSVHCEANVGILVREAAVGRYQNRFFNWEVTLDGSRSFIAATPTSVGRTTLHGLPPRTVVGVRVCLSSAAGAGPWSQVVTTLVV